MRGLAYFCREVISTLLLSVKEVAMDATFGTNNAGMDLFALLAELDGTGVPLAYCFVETVSIDNTRHSEPGALTAILDKFLRVLKAGGLDPAFFWR